MWCLFSLTSLPSLLLPQGRMTVPWLDANIQSSSFVFLCQTLFTDPTSPSSFSAVAGCFMVAHAHIYVSEHGVIYFVQGDTCGPDIGHQRLLALVSWHIYRQRLSDYGESYCLSWGVVAVLSISSLETHFFRSLYCVLRGVYTGCRKPELISSVVVCKFCIKAAERAHQCCLNKPFHCPWRVLFTHCCHFHKRDNRGWHG